MSQTNWLIADVHVNGWTIAGIIIGVVILAGIIWNIKDIARYIRISRM